MKFAIEVRPFFGETFTSWFARSAFANGTDPKSFALAIWRQDSTWYKDIDRYLTDDKINILSSVCSLSKKEIRTLTLAPIIKNLVHANLANAYKWGFVTPMGLKGAIRTNGMYFCPECLKEKIPYIKQEWKFAWSVSCAIHKKLLILTCEKCNHVFSPHHIDYSKPNMHFCTSCGYDLRKSHTEDVNKEALKIQQMLTEIAFNKRNCMSFPLVNPDKKDLFLTLNILLSFFSYIYKHEKYDTIFKQLKINKDYTFHLSHNTTFSRMNIKDREYLLRIMHSLFQLKLSEIITMLEDSNVSKRTLIRTHKYISPTIDFIQSNLSSAKIKKPPRQVFKKIAPKSQDEVNKLFNEVKSFI